MSVIWRKVWFDLWNNKVRTLLAVLSIAVGVFAIGAIFGMVDQLLPGMDRAHQASRPSHITLTLSERMDQDTADRLKNIEGVEDIEVSNAVAIRYKLKPEDEWQAGFLQIRDDYEEQKYDLRNSVCNGEVDGCGLSPLSWNSTLAHATTTPAERAGGIKPYRATTIPALDKMLDGRADKSQRLPVLLSHSAPVCNPPGTPTSTIHSTGPHLRRY